MVSITHQLFLTQYTNLQKRDYMFYR